MLLIAWNAVNAVTELLTSELERLRCSSSTAAKRHTVVVTVDVDVMIRSPHASTHSKQSSAPSATGNDDGGSARRWPTWSDSANSTRRTTLLKRLLRCWCCCCGWWRSWHLPLMSSVVNCTPSLHVVIPRSKTLMWNSDANSCPTTNDKWPGSVKTPSQRRTVSCNRCCSTGSL